MIVVQSQQSFNAGLREVTHKQACCSFTHAEHWSFDYLPFPCVSLTPTLRARIICMLHSLCHHLALHSTLLTLNMVSKPKAVAVSEVSKQLLRR